MLIITKLRLYATFFSALYRIRLPHHFLAILQICTVTVQTRRPELSRLPRNSNLSVTLRHVILVSQYLHSYTYEDKDFSVCLTPSD